MRQAGDESQSCLTFAKKNPPAETVEPFFNPDRIRSDQDLRQVSKEASKSSAEEGES